MSFPEVDTPALLLDLDQVERNVDRYQRAASAAGLQLRPHAKAHKTVQLGRLQIERGAIGVCCAKLAEAEALAAQGLEASFLITTPVVDAGKIRRLVELAKRARIMLVVDGEENVAELGRTGVTLDVLVEVDVGQGRTGVVPGAAARLAAMVSKQKSLRFRGLQGYQGRLQGVASLEERTALVREAMAKLAESERAVKEAGLPVEIKSGGGSGSFPIDLELKMLTELQPGSYVTMDTNYAKVDLGGDHSLGNPLTVLTSVVSRPVPDRAVVDAGWKSASSDSGVPSLLNGDGHGFEFAGDEHGIVRRNGAPVAIAPGDRLQLIPSHCDTTVNLYDSFVIHRSGKVTGTWPIVGRGKAQ